MSGYFSMSPFERELIELMIASPEIRFLVAERFTEADMDTADGKRLFSAVVAGSIPDDDVANQCKSTAFEKLRYVRNAPMDRLLYLVRLWENRGQVNEQMESLTTLQSQGRGESHEALKLLSSIIRKYRQAEAIAVPKPFRIKLHIKFFGYWWKQIDFVPPQGTLVVPLDSDFLERLDWDLDLDSFTVHYTIFLAEKNLACVETGTKRIFDGDPPLGFDKAMVESGWTKGDALAWV